MCICVGGVYVSNIRIKSHKRHRQGSECLMVDSLRKMIDQFIVLYPGCRRKWNHCDKLHSHPCEPLSATKGERSILAIAVKWDKS